MQLQMNMFSLPLSSLLSPFTIFVYSVSYKNTLLHNHMDQARIASKKKKKNPSPEPRTISREKGRLRVNLPICPPITSSLSNQVLQNQDPVSLTPSQPPSTALLPPLAGKLLHTLGSHHLSLAGKELEHGENTAVFVPSGDVPTAQATCAAHRLSALFL